MGFYGDKKDYEQIVKENIFKAKLLSSIPESNRTIAISLLEKREEISQKNGLFVNFELKKNR